ALFFMLTLWAYARYALAREEGSRPDRTPLRKSAAKKPVCQPQLGGWFVAALGFFACGLMSKPMLVTLPFVLLLQDYWPLRRFPLPGVAPGPRFWSLLKEKTPFFVLSLASSVVTFVVQRSAGAMPSLERLTLWERLCN